MIVMRQRVAALATAVLAVAVATPAWSTPALADTPGFAVKITSAPSTFTIGRSVRTLSAFASTDRAKRCHRVRWALVVRTEGISLDQVRIDRIENSAPFPARAVLGADAARVVDVQPDPGQLCRGRTVTGQWRISFTGPDDGDVSFEARALDGGDRLLAAGSATSRVVTPVAAGPTPTPSNSASPSPSFSPEPTEAVVADLGETPSAKAAAPANSSGGLSALAPGLIVGAVLVFFGVGLLLRLRSRNRRHPAWQAETQVLPTGFYSMPQRRRR
jgi:hypothetical protein